ncbi:MAG: GNAT family N-acetyltransferase [Candidatus Limnocylindrales bacterium]
MADGAGPYPLFCCVDWQGLAADLDDLREDLVSAVLVADPFGQYDEALLHDTFDLVVPFKQHFIAETGRAPASFVNARHRRHALRALRHLTVDVCADPRLLLGEWERLYAVLVARRGISSTWRFSRDTMAHQLAIPGLVAFRACEGSRVVGLDLWYVQGECAQGHVAAFDERGYALRASYATKWTMLEYFSERVRYINLGGGQTSDASDGLAAFKRGWATGTRPAWLCGRILQPKQYAALAHERMSAAEGYFPAYRATATRTG